MELGELPLAANEDLRGNDFGRLRDLEASENLSAWIGIGSVTTDGSGTSLFIDSSAPNYPQRFYRVTE